MEIFGDPSRSSGSASGNHRPPSSPLIAGDPAVLAQKGLGAVVQQTPETTIIDVGGRQITIGSLPHLNVGDSVSLRAEFGGSETVVHISRTEPALLSGASSLQVGQQLPATVIERTGANRFLIGFRGERVAVTGPEAIGDHGRLQLRVVQVRPNLILDVISAEVDTSRTATRLLRERVGDAQPAGKAIAAIRQMIGELPNRPTSDRLSQAILRFGAATGNIERLAKSTTDVVTPFRFAVSTFQQQAVESRTPLTQTAALLVGEATHESRQLASQSRELMQHTTKFLAESLAKVANRPAEQNRPGGAAERVQSLVRGVAATASTHSVRAGLVSELTAVPAEATSPTRAAAQLASDGRAGIRQLLTQAVLEVEAVQVGLRGTEAISGLQKTLSQHPLGKPLIQGLPPELARFATYMPTESRTTSPTSTLAAPPVDASADPAELRALASFIQGVARSPESAPPAIPRLPADLQAALFQASAHIELAASQAENELERVISRLRLGLSRSAAQRAATGQPSNQPLLATVQGLEIGVQHDLRKAAALLSQFGDELLQLDSDDTHSDGTLARLKAAISDAAARLSNGAESLSQQAARAATRLQEALARVISQADTELPEGTRELTQLLARTPATPAETSTLIQTLKTTLSQLPAETSASDPGDAEPVEALRHLLTKAVAELESMSPLDRLRSAQSLAVLKSSLHRVVAGATHRSLPPAVLKLEAALKTILPDGEPAGPDEIRAFLQNNGLQFEAELARLAAEDPDSMKRLADTDLKGILLQAEREIVEGTGNEHLRSLLEPLMGQLAHIESQQLLNLLAQLQESAFQFQIPFLNQGEPETAFLSIEPDEHSRGEDGRPTGYNIVLTLELDGLGNTRIDGHMTGDTARVIIYAEDAESVALMNELLPELEQELIRVGFEKMWLAARPMNALPGDSRTGFGTPPADLTASRDYLVDEQG